MPGIQTFNGTVVKSIQVGSITIAATSDTNTAAIAAVDVNKAVCLFSGCIGGGPNATDILARIALTNSTTVTATRAGTNNNTIVGFTVLEFY